MVKVRVKLGVPEELLKDKLAPELPDNPPKAAAVVVQEELLITEWAMPGGPAYGLLVMDVLPNCCWYT